MAFAQDGDLYNSKVFYSPGVLRTYLIALLDVFNDIKVRQYEADFITIKKTIDVPIQYGSTEKEYMERMEDATHEGGDRYYQTVPRMALVLSDITRDSSRAKSVNENRSLNAQSFENPNQFLNDYEPTPMNFMWELKIKFRKTEHLQQILEQILPYFNPSISLRVKEIPFLNIERDIITTLDASGLSKHDEMDSTQLRDISVSLPITMRGFMYRPIRELPILQELYRMISIFDADGNPIQDRREITQVAVTEDGIPLEATNIKLHGEEGQGGYWTYTIIDNEVNNG